MNQKKFLFIFIAFCLSILTVSLISSYSCQPEEESYETVKIALWGDSRENKDNACENIADILLNDITDWDFQVHVGDFTSSGSEEDWQRSLNYKGIDKLFIPGRFFMCTSNHDRNQETWDKYTDGILPVNSANNTTHFYAHRMGNVHVIFCDAYFTDADVMQTWLDGYLEKNVRKDDWLIGVWHPPSYGDITYKDSYLDKCLPWLESLHRYGGDFIFNGHAHIYLRSQPLLPDGTVDYENGMVHIVNGAGGASWKPAQKYTEKTAFTPDTESFPAVTFVTLEKNKAVIQTIDARPENKLNIIDEWTWGREK